VNEGTGRIELTGADAGRFVKMLQSQREYKNYLLEVPFASVHEYLFILRLAAEALCIAGNRGMLFLASGVLKHYVPYEELRPFSVADDAESQQFHRVPHLMLKIRREWCPKAYVVSFKLAENSVVLSDKAHAQMEMYGTHLVVGNVVGTHKTWVVMTGLYVILREAVNI